jgi:tRNA modification GTPase
VIAQFFDSFLRMSKVRMAEAGEFTRRAFMHGKMDLTAVEGLADLIDSDTESQRKQALRIMQHASGFYEKLRHAIVHSLAYLEAYIDFPDEDIPEHVLSEIDGELAQIRTAIAAQLSDNHVSEKIRDGVYITILGAPNVGKSSLMNVLAKRDVAIVSDIAGTTRDVIEVSLDIGGYSVIIADTAGIREQADSIEKEGIRRSLERAANTDIKIILTDVNAPDILPASLSELSPDNTIILLNKIDMNPTHIPRHIERIPVIALSVITGQGIDTVIEAIAEKISTIIPSESSFITRTRHRHHLEQALYHIQQYTALQAQGLELRCEELRRAAMEIGKITGAISVDEILGKIFSSFCIGK